MVCQTTPTSTLPITWLPTRFAEAVAAACLHALVGTMQRVFRGTEVILSCLGCDDEGPLTGHCLLSHLEGAGKLPNIDELVVGGDPGPVLGKER